MKDKKINNYKGFIKERVGDEDYSGWDDSFDEAEYAYNSYDGDEYDDGDYNDDGDDDMDNLLYLLRKMFNNSGIDNVDVVNKKMDLTIYIELSHRERLRDIIKAFEVVNKLRKDILAQYDSEFELWNTKKGNPLLTFNFYYDIEDDDVLF